MRSSSSSAARKAGDRAPVLVSGRLSSPSSFRCRSSSGRICQAGRVPEIDVVARHLGEAGGGAVHPDQPGDRDLAAHHHRPGRAAGDHQHLVAARADRLFGAAEDHQGGAGEAGGDLDVVARQRGDQRHLLRAGPWRQGAAAAGPAASACAASERRPGAEQVPRRPQQAPEQAERHAQHQQRRAAPGSPRPFSLVPIAAPNCAPATPPTSSSMVSRMSTVPSWTACSRVTLAATKTTWNSEVPMTTEVGMPSR